MITLWYAWRSLPLVERTLLAAALAVLTFCAGVNWQMAHSRAPLQPLLQEASAAQVVQWNSPRTIVVHVAGAVRHPGIVHLPRGSRVQDAVHQVGGILPDAKNIEINLAALLRDGQKLTLSSVAARQNSVNRTKSTFSASKSGRLLNINNANAAQLQALPAIGPVLAGRILEYRKNHGAFRNLNDLGAVKGIGQKTLEKLQPLLVFQ